MWLIGDCQGQHNEVKELVVKCRQTHPNDEIIFVGDLVDRGPESADLIKYIRSLDNCRVVKGNHEDMLVDYVLSRVDTKYRPKYHHRDWIDNGGYSTLESYSGFKDEVLYNPASLWLEYWTNLKSDADWLASLPTIIQTDDLIITHAPLSSRLTDEEVTALTMEPKLVDLWSRDKPVRRNYRFQFFGHNGRLRTYSDTDGDFAMCIDSTRESPRCLTAIHYPTFEIIQVDF